MKVESDINNHLQCIRNNFPDSKVAELQVVAESTYCSGTAVSEAVTIIVKFNNLPDLKIKDISIGKESKDATKIP